MDKYPGLEINLWAFYLIFCSLQALYLSLVFLIRKEKGNYSFKVLASVLIVLGLIIGDYALNISNLLQLVPHFIYTTGALWYLLGPLIYFYLKVLLKEKNVFHWKSILHFIPFMFILWQLIPFYLLPAQIKLEYFLSTKNQPSSTTIQDLIYTYTYMLQVVVYLFLNVRKLNQHINLFKVRNSNTNIIHLNWLKTVLFAFMVYQTFETSISIYLNITGKHPDEFVYSTYCILSTFILAVGYTALQQPLHSFSEIVEIKPKKYETSVLKNDDIEKHLSTLKTVMKNQKPFLNNELKLDDLAVITEIPAHQLSQVLSQGLNTNFYDYINSYRIEESKKRLIDPEYKNLTIIGIAFDVGFNSKASFYRVFKKHTNQTPSEYIKLHEPAQVA